MKISSKLKMELLFLLVTLCISGFADSDPMNYVFNPGENGADPTGVLDSTTSIQSTIDEAFSVAGTNYLMPSVVDRGGVEIQLGGGQYLISQPLTLPSCGGGNVLIHGGTLRASNLFPSHRYLIEFGSPGLMKQWMKNGELNSEEQTFFEYITFDGLMLDANYRGGGILLLKPLRTTIQNCYIAHFMTEGISVQGGHETLIQNSFLGQHINLQGGDPNGRNSGTAVLLSSNDNSISNVVIFSAQVGIDVDGQANMIFGVHCYNKPIASGGSGIFVRRGSSKTRVLGCYMDYTGIILEETTQITITNTFFYYNAFVLLKQSGAHESPPNVSGVVICDNMFYGSGEDVPIIQLEGQFSHIKQTVVDRNSAQGMALRTTRSQVSTSGLAKEWKLDLSQVLLFPNSIAHVYYSFYAPAPPAINHNAPIPKYSKEMYFPQHALQAIRYNQITIVCDRVVQAFISTYVDQSF